jgi:hypothetical protein
MNDGKCVRRRRSKKKESALRNMKEKEKLPITAERDKSFFPRLYFPGGGGQILSGKLVSW